MTRKLKKDEVSSTVSSVLSTVLGTKVKKDVAYEIYVKVIDELFFSAREKGRSVPLGSLADVYFKEVKPRKIKTPLMSSFKRTLGGFRLAIKNKVHVTELEKAVKNGKK